MGYKSVLRGASSSLNAAARGADRASRQAQREQEKEEREIARYQEKLAKKAAALKEKQAKPLHNLKDLFAKGKVDRKTYKNLERRQSEISPDLILFGKRAGLTLASRYVTGKVDKKTFLEQQKEIIGDVIDEKDEIVKLANSQEKELKDFIKKCGKSKKSTEKCSCCGKTKSFFKRIKEIDGLNLCGNCVRDYKQLLVFDGFDGEFFIVEQISIRSDGKSKINFVIKNEHIVNS